jgi:hypothetical protein
VKNFSVRLFFKQEKNTFFLSREESFVSEADFLIQAQLYITLAKCWNKANNFFNVKRTQSF